MTDSADFFGARRRAGIYAVLSLAFHRPPDGDQAARFSVCAGEASWNEWADLRDVLATLARLAAETPRESLRQDFDDLFNVPGPKYVTPYQSVYCDEPLEINNRKKNRTCGPSMQAASAFYTRVGLEVARDYPELRDYIGLELSCMEYLCVREAEYLESGAADSAAKTRELQRSFLERHLCAWIQKLGAEIRNKAETEFYRTLASLTQDWLERESKLPCLEA